MNIAVIFAGGVGTRMKSKDLPKQFLIIHGKPILIRTVELFQNHKEIDAIVVVCNKNWVDYCIELLQKYKMDKVLTVVIGGVTGQDSIFNGLCAAEKIAKGKESIVLIHDGVRPLITEKTITNNIVSVQKYGSAITCVPAKETVLMINNKGIIECVPDRDTLRMARAPQSFWLKDILFAHREAIAEGKHNYIDSATMMFDKGIKLRPVEGPYENIKITTPEDFFVLQSILNARENQQIFNI